MSFATAALALKGLRQLAASKWLSPGNYAPKFLLPFPQKFDYQEDTSQKTLPGGDVTADKSNSILSATATIGWAKMKLTQIAELLGSEVIVSGSPGNQTVVVKRRTGDVAPFFMWQPRVNYVGPEYPSGEFTFKFYKGNVTAPPKIALQTEEYASLEIQVTFYEEESTQDFYDYIANEAGSPLVEASDSTPPTIVSITPADNATGVDRTDEPVIVFSEPVRKDDTQFQLAKVVSTTNILEVDFEVEWNSDGDEAKLKHATPFDATSVFNIRVGAGIQDLVGNFIAGATNSQFTTGS